MKILQKETAHDHVAMDFINGSVIDLHYVKH